MPFTYKLSNFTFENLDHKSKEKFEYRHLSNRKFYPEERDRERRKALLKIEKSGALFNDCG